MSVKALRNQLLGAIAMVLVAAIALGSSTFAWFAINSTVNVTGMKMKTSVQDNLFIAASTHANTGKEAEKNFRTTLVQQNTDKLVEPVSTIDGKAFWYALVNNVSGEGSVFVDSWKNYGTEGLADANKNSKNDFNDNYSTTGAVGFVDYVYQLKAVAGAATTLRLTKLDLTYAETQAGFDNTSFRAAVFVQDITDSGAAASTGNTAITATTTIQDTTLSKLFAPSGATNFHKGDSDNPQAVSAADATKNVTYNNNTEAISVGEGTHYYKVVVRVWLEGEDTHCNNTTFAKLDEGEWGLDVEWQLGGSTALANQLKVTQTATRTALTGIASSVSGTPVKINDVDYYKINTVKNVDYYVATNAAVTTTSRVYTITEGRVTDVTHLVTITLAT